MADSVLYNKKKFCYTDPADFTHFQGIGSDPIYRRYDSVWSVVNHYISPKYRHFLATPDYRDGVINWYVPEYKDAPRPLSSLNGAEKAKYEAIKKETVTHYRQVCSQLPTDEMAILLSAIRYIDDRFIYCSDDQVVLVAWGMEPDNNKTPVHGVWAHEYKTEVKYPVVFDCGSDGHLVRPEHRMRMRPEGHKITDADIPEVAGNEGHEFAGWDPDPLGREVKGPMTFKAVYRDVPVTPVTPVIPGPPGPPEELKEPEPARKAVVTFLAGEHGSFAIPGAAPANAGAPVPPPIGGQPADSQEEIEGAAPPQTPPQTPPGAPVPPPVAPGEPPQLVMPDGKGKKKKKDKKNKQQNVPEGPRQLSIEKPIGLMLTAADIPQVTPRKGYTFTGWNISPMNLLVNGDITLTAQYKRSKPWWKRLAWLWWLLLGLLLLLLLLWLLKDCQGCSGKEPLLPDDEVKYVDKKDNGQDDNGVIHDIRDKDDNLPDDPVVAPIYDEDGEKPPIVKRDGVPDAIGNRLLIFFEDSNVDMDAWARDFSKVYPDKDNYKIVGADKLARTIVIQIPEAQRDQVREELPSKMSNYEFFVMDETILQLKSHGQGQESPYTDPSQFGWHIRKTNMRNAWPITKGGQDVVVAIVDDGFEIDHPMLAGRFYKGYNVFTQNRNMGKGSGHGTHVAGLALGTHDNLAKGAAGVAPNVKFMPVMVFDNDVAPQSALISGIMYAIHNGADVVNISVGPRLDPLKLLSLENQDAISRQMFKNEEKLYQHIAKTANQKNVILVFASGNSSILARIIPANRQGADMISVAAVDVNLNPTEFTNHHEGTNISAPGANIYSSVPDHTLGSMDGTSQAAPIVTGAVALMRSLKRDLTVQQALGVLQKTGVQIGNGSVVPPMLQIDRALQAVKSGDIPDGPSWTPGSGGGGPVAPGQEVVVGPGDGPGEDVIVGDDRRRIVDKQPVDKRRKGSDYDELQRKLDELMRQRDKLDREINDLRKRIK